MSKDIWHTKDEIPRQESRVVWKSGNVVCGGRFDTHYKCFCGPASQFINLRKVSRWCYLDDLLSCEQELIRTRLALDVALDWLGQVATPAKCDDEFCREFTKQKLIEIKTALEQKETK